MIYRLKRKHSLNNLEITFEIIDGDSKLELSIIDDEIQIRRPNKGMTPKLEEIAKIMLDGEDGNKEEMDKALNFVMQSKNMTILIGEERCG